MRSRVAALAVGLVSIVVACRSDRAPEPVHLTLPLDFRPALTARRDRLLTLLELRLADAKIAVSVVGSGVEDAVLTMRDPSRLADVRPLVGPGLSVRAEAPARLDLGLAATEAASARVRAAQQTAAALEGRLALIGLGSSRVAAEGGRISITLSKQPPMPVAQLRGLLGRSARVTFRFEDEGAVSWALLDRLARSGALAPSVLVQPARRRDPAGGWHVAASIVAPERALLQPVLAGVPAEAVLYEQVSMPVGAGWRAWLVEQRALLTGEDLEDVAVEGRPGGGRGVHLRLAREGAGILRRVTPSSVGRRLVIALDREVLIAPVIDAPIDEGFVFLDVGRDDDADRRAQELAFALRAGLVPTAVAQGWEEAAP